MEMLTNYDFLQFLGNFKKSLSETTRPASRPASQAASKPASQAASQPASQPTSQPTRQPAKSSKSEHIRKIVQIGANPKSQ